MPTIIEPREAGIIIALISKLIINNFKFGEFVGCTPPELEPEPEIEDSSSNTTSISDVVVHVHHM